MFVIDCCVSELSAHLCPYRNLWPEVVLQKWNVYRIVHMLVSSKILSLHQVSLLYQYANIHFSTLSGY